MITQKVQFSDLGIIGYQQAWDLQETLLKKNLNAKALSRATRSVLSDANAPGRLLPHTAGIPHTHLNQCNGIPETADLTETRHYLLFCEHPPVYTLGKSGKPEHILISEEDRRRRGVEFFPTNRGGDITFHGPEQLVGYPILDLEKYDTDIGRYLRNLESVIIEAIATWGLKGERSRGETGVWLDPEIPGRERKICAMGVRCSRWITMHGFALNVNTDLSYFDDIIPCGIRGKQVTSLQKELGQTISMEAAKDAVKKAFESVFRCQLINADLLV